MVVVEQLLTQVSIHAFRGEGDLWRRARGLRTSVFQSTPSGGKATFFQRQRAQGITFQSTPSGGKATVRDAPGDCRIAVSIHAFRGEGDLLIHPVPTQTKSFNPRLPGGRRLTNWGTQGGLTPFQSTPSGGKATWNANGFDDGGYVSIHAFRGEGDLARA